MFYLAPYIGTGKRGDLYRPLGSEQPGWSAIDLRADCTRRDGYALVYLPERDARLTPLAEHGTEPVHRRLERKLGVPVERGPFASAVARLLLRPPTRGWGRLMPAAGRYEVWLGGLLWSSPVLYGASATDNFNRTSETPLAAPWVKSGAGANINLVGDSVIESASSGDTFYYYTGGATTADQYAQVLLAFPSGGTGDGGPACRIDGSAITGYFAEASTDTGIVKLVAGAGAVVQALTVSYVVNDVIRLEVQGSTLRQYKNGVQVTPSGTDTSITVAGAGVGVFINSGIQLDDFAGGDLGQTLLPDADLATGGWGTAPLYSKWNDSSDATIGTATAS